MQLVVYLKQWVKVCWFFAPHANSWRRLVLGSYAPVRPNWGLDNRSVAFRIPSSSNKNRRIEHRVSGVDANPYLVALTVLSAIRYGMKNKIKPPEQTKGNAYKQKQNSNIKMPHDWSSAIIFAKKSKFLKEIFPQDVLDHYIHAAEWEQKDYDGSVNDWQLRRYFERG